MGGAREGEFVEIDRESAVLPARLTRSDSEGVVIPLQGVAVTLRERPVATFVAIKGDIDRAVVIGLGASPLACPGVIRGKDAADEQDDGQPVAPVIAQGVDVPPDIAALRDRMAEVRSASTCSAARRPDIIAIGRPAPGWVLPPARYRPGTRVRAPGR